MFYVILRVQMAATSALCCGMSVLLGRESLFFPTRTHPRIVSWSKFPCVLDITGQIQRCQSELQVVQSELQFRWISLNCKSRWIRLNYKSGWSVWTTSQVEQTKLQVRWISLDYNWGGSVWTTIEVDQSQIHVMWLSLNLYYVTCYTIFKIAQKGKWLPL